MDQINAVLTSSLLKCDRRVALYLCDEVSDKGDVGVELLQTAADVAHHRQHVAPAQQVDHAVQQRLLQLQLQRSEVRGQGSEVRGQGSEVRGQRSEVRGQRSEVTRDSRWSTAIVSQLRDRSICVLLGTSVHMATPAPNPNPNPNPNPHLLHDVQLGVLRLKQLDEQLENLRVKQLVAGADLGRRGEVVNM